jgi:malonyl-CoA O-methyltransferase
VNRVDKARLREAFSRGAAEYDEHARVQRAAAERVLALAAAHAPAPRRALDVGAGTGSLMARLAARHRAAAVTGVDLAAGMARQAAARVGPRCAVGDAEALPFRDGAFDLVVSSSTLQWVPRLEPALREAARVLDRGGTLALALFGDGTLRELREAWHAALPRGAADRTHEFFSRADLERALAAAGLEPLAIGCDRHVESHPSVLDLLRALRRIGAGNAAPERPRSLAEAYVVTRMIARYPRPDAADGVVRATWDVLWAAARRR